MAAAINWFQAIRIRLLISVAHIEVGFGVHFGSGFLAALGGLSFGHFWSEFSHLSSRMQFAVFLKRA
jgi:hypothetical protein